MKSMTFHPLSLAALVLSAVCGLSACGGGGGAAATEAAPVVPVTPAEVTFDTVVPGDSMTWTTTASQALQVTVRNAAGVLVPDAAVRLFTLSSVSPHDDTPLENPVAFQPIDAAATAANGVASFSAQLPAHLTEVMVVATWEDQSVSQRLVLASAAAGVSLSTAP